MLRTIQRTGTYRALKYRTHKIPSSSVIRPNSSGNNDDRWRNGKEYFRPPKFTALLGLGVIATIKDYVGYEKAVPPPEDEVVSKIRMSILHRRRGKYDEAIELLLTALNEVKQKKNEMHITRVYDELANTYYEKGEWDTAFDLFREVVKRLIQIHSKSEVSPEFIGISLKLADIFAQRGDIENAETGYRHCMRTQMEIVRTHLDSHFVSRGAAMELLDKVDELGPAYTNPLALFGMCLEKYAHFLIEYRDESRLNEAREFIDEALKIESHIFGPGSAPLVNTVFNFGTMCVGKKYFETAIKYFQIGVDSVLTLDDCAFIIVPYYCNYAEALFHCGNIDEALNYAAKARLFARDEAENVRRYANDFYRDMKRDERSARTIYRAEKAANSTSSGGFFSWFWAAQAERPASSAQPETTKTSVQPTSPPAPEASTADTESSDSSPAPATSG